MPRHLIGRTAVRGTILALALASLLLSERAQDTEPSTSSTSSVTAVDFAAAGAAAAPAETESMSIAESYAADYGVSVEDASKILDLQVISGDLVSTLAERFGENSFDAWREVSAGAATLVVRTDDVEIVRTAERLADAAGVPLSTLHGVAFSSQGDVLVDLIPRIQDVYAGDTSALQGAYIDAKTGQIVLDVRSSSAAQESSAESLVGSAVRVLTHGPRWGRMTASSACRPRTARWEIPRSFRGKRDGACVHRWFHRTDRHDLDLVKGILDSGALPDLDSLVRQPRRIRHELCIVVQPPQLERVRGYCLLHDQHIIA